jgi:hypothetical protein
MAEDPGTVYRVCFAKKDIEQLSAWAEKAERLGIKKEYTDALKTIQEKLATEPLTWGDPQYQLRYLGLLLHHRVHWFLHIAYAVDEARRLVYVKECRPMPGHALEEE